MCEFAERLCYVLQAYLGANTALSKELGWAAEDLVENSNAWIDAMLNGRERPSLAARAVHRMGCGTCCSGLCSCHLVVYADVIW